MKSENSVYQFKVTLKDSRPPIWRRFTMPAEFTLLQLHEVLQTLMGWEEGHLHEFVVGSKRYALSGGPGEMFGEFDDDDVESEEKARLCDVVKRLKSKIVYLYDFGDDWTHDVILEKILPPDTEAPVCLDGKRAGPPDDCGGVWGYENLLETLSDPSSAEHEDMMEWIGDDFDPEAFFQEELNKSLRANRYLKRGKGKK